MLQAEFYYHRNELQGRATDMHICSRVRGHNETIIIDNFIYDPITRCTCVTISLSKLNTKSAVTNAHRLCINFSNISQRHLVISPL